MKRQAMRDLIKWKNRVGHKPLIIQGARQVGKTWIMEEFARTQYENVAYIWFEKNERMAALFSGDMNTERLLLGLEAEVGETMFDAIRERNLIIEEALNIKIIQEKFFEAGYKIGSTKGGKQ